MHKLFPIWPESGDMRNEASASKRMGRAMVGVGWGVWAVLWDIRGGTFSHNQGQGRFSQSEQRC